MLAPHRLRRGGAGREAVRVLDRGVVDAVGRHVGGGEALAAERPARAVVLAEPHAAAGDAEHALPAVARIDAKRVDAGIVVAAAEPLRARRLVTQHLPQTTKSAERAVWKEGGGERERW